MSEDRSASKRSHSPPRVSQAKKSVSNLALSTATLSIDSTDHSASSSPSSSEASLPAEDMNQQQFDAIKGMFAQIQQTVHNQGVEIQALRQAQPNATGSW